MLHKHGPFKKFFNEYYEISVCKQPYLKSGTLAKKGPYSTPTQLPTCNFVYLLGVVSDFPNKQAIV